MSWEWIIKVLNFLSYHAASYQFILIMYAWIKGLHKKSCNMIKSCLILVPSILNIMRRTLGQCSVPFSFHFWPTPAWFFWLFCSLSQFYYNLYGSFNYWWFVIIRFPLQYLAKFLKHLFEFHTTVISFSHSFLQH